MAKNLNIALVTLLVLLNLAACGSESNPGIEEAMAVPAQPTATRTPAAGANLQATPAAENVSESALQTIRERSVLRAGVLYNYPPFTHLADDGVVEGYEVELLRRIAERWEIDVEFVQVTRQTRLPMLLGGDVDILAGAIPHTREMETYADFTATVFKSGYVILTRSDAGIGSAADLGSSAVGVIGLEAEATLTAYADQAGIAPSVQQYEDVQSAIPALNESQTIVAIVGLREDLMREASGAKGLEIVDEFVSEVPYAFAVRQGDAPLRDLIDMTLQNIVGDGQLGELFSASFYGYPADIFPVYLGQVAYDFTTFPIELVSESVTDRMSRGEPIRVAGLQLAEEPALFDGQPIIDGYNRAVLNEMARRWNTPIVEIPDSEGQKGLDLLLSGQADLVVGIYPERGYFGQLTLSQPYYDHSLRMIHMEAVTVLGIGDLEFKPSTAIPPLEISEDLIRDNNVFPSVTLEDDLEDAFRTLIGTTTYALIGDEYATILMAQADDRIQVMDDRYRVSKRVMAVPLFDAEFQLLINTTLQDMSSEGVLDDLREQYFGPYTPEDESLEAFAVEIWPGGGG